ncbi:stonustoxin subunit beta-like [Chanos chanos]|uniref:Stonustoxin subunit beta-like n=1 Tax=Chanos chanos TaxID=29144 RepID=A0A6J2VWL8_CHACN|nr:stonustoxin subunit beta-like [Chanos chanos]
MDSSNCLVLEALGRSLYLGTLYNACSDTLVPGMSLWSNEVIQKETKVNPQPNTSFQVAASESISEKIKLLDVSASVKASFFAGLVEVGGSAHYLNEKTSSKLQCRVTMQHQVNTVFKELMFSELTVQYPDVFKAKEATHVVTGVLYGANAILEFQDTASDASEKQTIQGSLNVMIKKIPLIEISAEGKVDLDDADKEKVKHFSCKFYGDYRLKQNPTTYEEAVLLYKDLPNLLGKDGELAVPLKVWLYPLKNLNDTALQLKHVISESLISQVEKMMDDLHQAEMRANDLLEISKTIKASDICDKLELFNSRLKDFTTVFSQKLAELLPTIREGTAEETALTDLLKSQHASGFNRSEIDQWLDGKETEIGIIKSYIADLKLEIKTPGPELDTFLMQPDVTDVFMFSFTSLKYEEPYLNKITKTTEDLRRGINISTCVQNLSEKTLWYSTPEVRGVLLSSLKIIQGFTFGLSIVTYVSDPEHPGASVRWYHNGICRDPHVTDIPFRKDAIVLTLEPNTAHNRLLLSEGNRKVTHGEDQSYPDNPERFDYWQQVLCKESLTEHCYWEAERSGEGLTIAVTYKGIGRKGESNAYRYELTLDPNTAHKSLCLSDANKTATRGDTQRYRDNSKRFQYWEQVLCKEKLTGRCYWEVEWSGMGAAVGVAYKGITRSDTKIGHNDKSWCVNCGDGSFGGNSFTAWHNYKFVSAPAPAFYSRRVGVFLDYQAGTLSFYSVCPDTHTLTHVHTFHAKFKEPLYAGFWVLETVSLV